MRKHEERWNETKMDEEGMLGEGSDKEDARRNEKWNEAEGAPIRSLTLATLL